MKNGLSNGHPAEFQYFTNVPLSTPLSIARALRVLPGAHTARPCPEDRAFGLRAGGRSTEAAAQKSFGIWTTLENRMKCGLGKCGRCNVGEIYVCKEGPVFTAAQVAAMPNDF